MTQTTPPAAAPAPPPTDQELIARYVAEKDIDAFAAVVERHSPMVTGVCQHILGNPHDAEDAMQATFALLAKDAHTLQEHPMIAGWLYRVAWNTSKQSLRSREIRRRHERNAAADQENLSVDGQYRELIEAIEIAVSELPDKYRMPIVLHHLQGFSEKESSEMLGCRQGTLSGRLSRARRMLRDRMRKYGYAGISLPVTDRLLESVPSALVHDRMDMDGIRHLTLEILRRPRPGWERSLPPSMKHASVAKLPGHSFKRIALLMASATTVAVPLVVWLADDGPPQTFGVLPMTAGSDGSAMGTMSMPVPMQSTTNANNAMNTMTSPSGFNMDQGGRMMMTNPNSDASFSNSMDQW